MSGYEGSWPEREAEERRRAMPNAAYADHATANGNSGCRPPGPPMALDARRDREGGVCKAERPRYRGTNRSQNAGVAPRPEARHLLTPEGMWQAAEETQQAADEEHRRITNTRVVGFMVKRARDGVEETTVPAGTPANQTDVTNDFHGISVSNRVAQANRMVASVNIDLAREVVRLECEIAQLREHNVILQTNNQIHGSHITAQPVQMEASRPVTTDDLDLDKISLAAEAESTVGA